MPCISVTRLRVRSVRFLPAFALDAIRTGRQVAAASGFRRGSLLNDRLWTFWTLTAWDSEASMRSYMTNGPHRVAMPKLMDWCDEASVLHWDQPEDTLPDWPEAALRMRAAGRPSKVRHPSAAHASLDFRWPCTALAAPIRPARRANA